MFLDLLNTFQLIFQQRQKRDRVAAICDAWASEKISKPTGKLPDIESVKSKFGKNLYIRKDRAMLSE